MTGAGGTTALIILDGWGYRPAAPDNAISNAHIPFWDRLWAANPRTLLDASGTAVGLPAGQMGNSEVGHINLGAGRVVYQNSYRISRAIEDGEFQTNPALVNAIDRAIRSGKTIHLLGLLSSGGVHSHESHLHAAAEMAAGRGAERLYVHAFLDGRDAPPRSAETPIRRMNTKLAELGLGRIASIVGRYFAMDRDNRWERTQQAYKLLVQAEAPYTAANPLEALRCAYDRGESDEFVSPTRVQAEGEQVVTLDDGDTVLFMNFRADRARQLARALAEGDGFDGFKRTKKPDLAAFVTLTQYSAELEADCAFPPNEIANDLGAYLSRLGKTQLRIAETEKYAHVTYFFSCGREQVLAGEERILVPSPKVATYDLQPEMSAVDLTDQVVRAIQSRRFDLIVCNYANADMLGHTGKLDAAVKAVECIDRCLERINVALVHTRGQALITADHGNCEQMTDEFTGQAHTAHTKNPVPLIYLGEKMLTLGAGGRLGDVAPTLLALMELDPPKEMTGQSLV